MLLKKPVETNYAGRHMFAGIASLLTLAVGAGIGLTQEVIIIITPDGKVQRISPNPEPGQPVRPPKEQAEIRLQLEKLLQRLNEAKEKVDVEALREEIARMVKQIQNVQKGRPEFRFDIDLILNEKGVEKARIHSAEAAKAAEAAVKAQADAARAQADELRKALENWQKTGQGDLEKLQKEIQVWTNRQQNNLQNYPSMWRVQPGQPAQAYGRFIHGGQGRLGARLERPSDALADQLNLPRGQGLVVAEVGTKSNLKVNDILLKVNGQTVPSEPAGLSKLLDGVKEEAVDATVLRRGKEEVVKGIKLATGVQGPITRYTPPPPPVPPTPPALAPLSLPGQQTVLTTNLRTNDRFTSRYQEGSLVITLTGKVKAGKAALGEIHIQDGTANHRFDNIDQVPAQYRDKVNHLLQSATAGDIRIEEKR